MGANLEITDSGIISPSTSEIKEAIQGIFVGAFGSGLSLDDSTPQGALIDSLTQLKQASNGSLLYLMNQFNPETASGIFQDALAKLYFIERKSATHSLVTCRCSGVTNTQLNGIADGNPVKVQSTNGDVFECVVGGRIAASGYIDLVFRSVETGPIPCGANTVNIIYQAIPGLDTVNNPNAGTIGEEQESRASFEKRRTESLALQATGSLAAVQAGLANLDGIEDYKVWENATGNQVTVRGVTLKAHSIWVCVNSAVSADDIATVIYQNKSAGCDTNGSQSCLYIDGTTGVAYTYSYDNPSTSNVYIKVKLTSSVPQSIQQQIKDVIVNNFNGTADDNSVGITIGDTVYASRFFGDVSALGVGLVTIQVSKTSGSGYTDTLTYNMNQLPTIDAANISIEVA